MNPVLFFDAEAILCSYLRAELIALVGTMHVGTNVPTDNFDGEFVRLIRTGGPKQTQVSDNPQITIECWARTEDRAFEIATNVRALLIGLQSTSYGTTTFYRMFEFTGPQNNPDPDSDQPRYSWTFTIGCRGEAL